MLYVETDDAARMVDTLRDVARPGVAARLAAAGLERARRFSWADMAARVRDVLLRTAARGAEPGAGRRRAG